MRHLVAEFCNFEKITVLLPIFTKKMTYVRTQRGGGWDGIEWHVHYGGDSSHCGSFGGSLEAFPVRPSRLVHVDVAVDQARHEHVVPGINDLKKKKMFTPF